jgi:alginate O-acetyltransferase complex protein AlgI
MRDDEHTGIRFPRETTPRNSASSLPSNSANIRMRAASGYTEPALGQTTHGQSGRCRRVYANGRRHSADNENGMLFTTTTFVLLFLPAALIGFYLLGNRSPTAAATWLLLASLLFYSHWHPVDTIILVCSIAVNFAIGRRISAGGNHAKGWLICGVIFNLGQLALFKYGDFLAQNLNLLPGVNLPLPGLELPIGISFYSFTQIAFLVDAYRLKVNESQPVHYGLFVTYFPHLIAGPVLHHAQMMPQFANRSIYSIQSANLIGGLGIFAIGLFKKVVLADGVSPYADAVFNASDLGKLPTAGEAWLGALAYTAQLYFDFSGYSDMAIGLSWMFNVRLPYNFDSPYKASNISEFWRRWHISLSTFLRDYLYIALGGNRRGELRRYLNLAATMVLGGLWHGAAWTFVAWGALHGFYLTVHHGFRAIIGEARHAWLGRWMAWRIAAWAMTMLSVVVAWVLFRAGQFTGAMAMLSGMAGMNPGPIDTDVTSPLLWNAGLSSSAGWMWCVMLGAVAVLAPNSNHLGERLLAWCHARTTGRQLLAGAALALVLGLLLVNATRGDVSAFIYFNF